MRQGMRGDELRTALRTRHDHYRFVTPTALAFRLLLTYMATWQQIEANLEPFVPVLDQWEQPWRTVYGTNEFVRWFNDDLANMQTRVYADIPPQEQVSARLHAFVAGDSLRMPEQFKILTPNNKHIWEIKTVDIRVFGWFPHPDVFVAVCGEDKSLIQDYKLYPELCDAADRVRTALGAEDYVKGTEYHDVLSDCC